MKKSILSLVVSTVLSTSALATSDPGATTYMLDGNELVEKFDDNFEVRYSKLAALPAACNSKAPKAITEKHSNQPPANIQGYWESKDSALIGNDSAKTGNSALHIRATGQLDMYITYDKECEAFSMGELDGNKLTQEVPAPIETETQAVVLNALDKQLLWSNVDGYSTDGKTSKSASAWLLDKSTTAIPGSCKLNEKLPTTQKSSNNPTAALVGIWKTQGLAADTDPTSYKELFIVTSEGYLATASLYDGQCESRYIGETNGNIYQK